MVEKLEAVEDRETASQAFRKVFVSGSPIGACFQPEIEHRCLLFPVLYELSPEIYGGVVEAATAIGETSAYVTLVEGSHRKDIEELPHWRIELCRPFPVDELVEADFVPIMEFALYSTEGRWGLLVSHEQH